MPDDATRQDERAFAASLTAALPRLRRFAISIAGNVSAADDLVQDALERAWRGRAGLDHPTVPFSWLRTILYNAHIDWRRRSRHDAAQVDIDAIADELTASAAPDPTAATEMMRALQKLSPDHKRVILLAGIENLSYAEIAEELAIPVGTVMSRLARARALLRVLLETGPRASPRRDANPGASP